MKRSWFFFSLLFAICVTRNLSEAQQKGIEHAEAEKEVLAKLERVGIPGDIGELIAALGYTDSTITYLRRQGFDLMHEMKARPRTERTKAFLSDCIVIGTVDYIEYDSSNTPYHSIAHVTVEKYLRNDYGLSAAQVKVAWSSGPIGGGKAVNSTGEDQLSEGEHVLLFLSAAALITEGKHRNSNFYRTQAGQSEKLFKIEGREGGKYIIDGRSLICSDGEHKLDDVLNDIKEMTGWLKRPPIKH